MKNILFVSHCIVNRYSKVVSFKEKEEYEYNLKDLLNLIYEKDIGLVQLGCPEMQCYGLKRWGHVREQFDHPHYRKECQKLAVSLVDQIIEYRKNDINIIGILGIMGSPSCGVKHTCSGNWYGEIGSNKNLDAMISTVKLVEGQGIFTEEIRSSLEKENIEVDFLEYNKKHVDKLIEEIESLMK